MLGLIEWQTAGERLHERRIGGARFLTVAIRRGDGVLAALSARQAARYLRQNGVTRAVFPRGFSHAARFASQGIEPVDVVPLREWMAAEIALCALRQRGISPEQATVALCRARVSRPLAEAAETLARSVRHLLLRTEHGGWEIAHELRRTLGVAVTVEPLRGRSPAALCLCFDAESVAYTDGLPLFDPALKIDYDAPIAHPDAEPEQLLAALCAAQMLRRGEITVRSIRRPASELPELRRDDAPSHA